MWVYNLALILTKVSILVQYLRIFPIVWFRKACYGMLGLVVAYGGWAVFSSIFICYPVTYSWNKESRQRAMPERDDCMVCKMLA